MSERYIGGLVYNPPGGWSAQFSGSNYLTVPNNAVFDMSTGDCTIEAWVYTTSLATSQAIFSTFPGGGTITGYGLLISASTGYLVLDTYISNGNQAIVASSNPVVTNTWVHVAYTRSGGTNRLFVNGNLCSTSTNNLTQAITSGGNTIGIGTQFYAGYPYYVNGYLSNVRVVKGTAVYTANFTPPTGALLPISGTSLLTCRYPTIVDGSTNAFTITNVNTVTVSTTNPFPTSVLPNPALGGAGNGIYTLSQYASLLGAGTWPAIDPYYENVTLNLHGNAGAVLPFNTDASTNNFQVTQVGDTRPSNWTPFITDGYWSNYFNGSSYLSLADNTAFDFAAGDFTIEAWVNFSSVSQEHMIASQWPGASNRGWVFTLDASASSILFAYTTNGTTQINASGTYTYTAGTWYHIVACRSGANLRLFINGAVITTYNISTNTIYNSTASMLIGAFSGGSTPIYGYMSNFRIVKGTAVYTSAFTPPTTPLTAISGTSVLTCQSNKFIDNSSNAFAITLNGSPSVNPYQPFTAPTGTSAYGSGYFDGTGDWLTPPASQTALTLATSDFTIEMWAYPTTQVRGNPSLFASDPGIGLANAILVQFSGTTGQTALWVNNTNLTASSTTNYIKLNQWNHVAVVRSGGSTYALYINGVAVNNVATNSTSLTTSNWYIGYWTVADNAYTGYMSNFRIVKGTAVYTSAFTPPTTPLTAITNTSLLTVQTNAPSQNNTFVDSSTNNFTITRNGNTTQGTFTPYGSNWSNYFDGSGDYLSIADNAAFTLGSGNFTIEAWIFPMSLPSSNSIANIAAQWASSANSAWLFAIYNNGGTIQLLFQPTSGGSETVISKTFAFAVGSFYHVAAVRNSNVITLYVNGTAVGTTTSYSSTIDDSTTALTIGSRASGDLPFTGYISNFRLVKGSAVYTSNFTPSTTPLTAITNTSLLTCQSNRFIDNSTNNFTITKNGDISVQRFSPFSPTTAYSTSVIGGSGYFDGSGDKLTVAANTAFQFGTGNFTVEFWLYPTSLSSYQTPIDMGYNSSGSYVVQTGNANGIPVFYSAGIALLTSSSAWNANAFNHVVVCRSGTTLSMFINGARTATATNSTNFNSNSTLGIGAAATASPDYPVVGYVSDVRLVKGSSVYDPTSSTLTVPTAPLTAITNTSLLLSYTNAGILDNAMMNDLETVGNAQISTSVKKYGTGSMYFDGVGDYISTVYKPIAQYGSANFTIEFWFYQNSRTAGEYDAIFRINSAGTGYGADMYMTIGAGVSGYTLAVSNNARNGWAVLLNPTGGLPALTTWHHMAIVRNGSTWTVYLNGSSVGTATYSGTVNTPSGAFEIGWAGTSDSYFDGYIDDFRITNGVARYTTTFTPPTAAFPDKG